MNQLFLGRIDIPHRLVGVYLRLEGKCRSREKGRGSGTRAIRRTGLRMRVHRLGRPVQG